MSNRNRARRLAVEAAEKLRPERPAPKRRGPTLSEQVTYLSTQLEQHKAWNKTLVSKLEQAESRTAEPEAMREVMRVFRCRIDQQLDEVESLIRQFVELRRDLQMGAHWCSEMMAMYAALGGKKA